MPSVRFWPQSVSRQVIEGCVFLRGGVERLVESLIHNRSVVDVVLISI